MTTRMLIDARHREETRVAVIKGNRIEEFDFESAEHKQLKGNIYLAKVTRVEPSLQAAFVEYGGNRHGFLAFSEIHPDYYQIPKEDREALLREEAEHAAEAAMRAEEDMEALEGDVEDMHGDDRDDDRRDVHDDDDGYADDDGDDSNSDNGDGDHHDRNDDDHDGEDDAEDGGEQSADGEGEQEGGNRNGRRGPRRDGRRGKGRGRGGRASEERDTSRMSLRRRYKIQDVIRRRQVMLVQVVKEERGNKGAALTTYLSLAGRYCVLMPNTMHGGGISRKISNGADRRKLKAMIDELDLPPTMGCIVRTAGMSRTKTEIKRDFDYLARLWDEIREKTLGSSAPALIHSDSDLIKRAIRDIYHRDIEDVLVEGEEGYRAAKEFMKLLMPSHARKVKQYADPVSLYQRYGVEDQLAGMYNPVVQLKSGGYLVINPTEALVSIDINSGRSTREHNIEQTALSTNLEAANEIARQLRLRDMAGLVVIDFIDMDHGSNARKVERAMKDALKNDRARIQIGRISGFGLMEMSRQRLRTGVLEASTRPCPHCEGTGLVRTASSAGLGALRMIEEEAARGKGSRITLRASQEATFYLLNEKRGELHEIEKLYGVLVEILPNSETEGAKMSVEVSGPPPVQRPQMAPMAIVADPDDDIDYPEDEDEGDDEERSDDGERDTRDRERSEDDGDGKRKRKRRRRGRRGRRDDENGPEVGSDDAEKENGEAGEDQVVAAAAAPEGEEVPAKPKRRRGGRGRKRSEVADTDGETAAPAVEALESANEAETAAAAEPDAVVDAPPAKPKRASRARKKAEPVEAEAPAVEAAAETEETAAEAPPAKPKRASRSRKAAAAAAEPAESTSGVVADEAASEGGSARKGWWQRTFG
jgi:ribonuclease E